MSIAPRPDRRRVGILGGTFDPVHRGHVAFALAACAQLALDRVYFVPALLPPHKEGEPLADASHRLEMVALAVAGEEKLSVSTIELDREGASYSIDTVRDFRSRLGESAQIFFLIGADTIGELATWKDVRELARLCTFAPVTRPGWSEDDLAPLSGVIDGDRIAASRENIVRMPGVDVSSTQIRDRLRQGQPIDDLVCDAVADYIEKHKLYR